jgi:CheY-like chemotaxis protein
MQASLETKPVAVLYVEDEESDAYFMRQAFRNVAPSVDLRTVSDGQQAIDYLGGGSGYSDRKSHPLPLLVLLDIHLPLLSGFEVLSWIRQQPEFKNLSVVIFSSSSFLQDKERADSLAANGYMQKPGSAVQFREVAEQLKRRWLSRSGMDGDRAGGQPMPRMRKLIQSRATKAFLAEGGKWTADWRHAQAFLTTEAAREVVAIHEINDVDLYYLFAEEPSSYDFTISV